VSESLKPQTHRTMQDGRSRVVEAQRIERARQVAYLERCAATGRLPIAKFSREPAPREQLYRRYQTPPLVAARAQLERAGYRVERP